jgi:murein DD-endopeptidase MepM/ murein hydrolase activator NlpD
VFVPYRRGLTAACVLAAAAALAVANSPAEGPAPTPSAQQLAGSAWQTGQAGQAGHGSGGFGAPAREAPSRADRASRAELTVPIEGLSDPRDVLEPRQATSTSPTLQEAAAELQRRREQAAAAAAQAKQQAAAAAVQAKQQAAAAAAAKAAQQRLAHLHRWVRPNYGGLSSPFGTRWGRMHEGIDLAGGYGSQILAATAGRVIYAGPESGYGRIVKILDWDGTQTWYGHMAKFLVKTGDTVTPGQAIALVGAAGDATGPHLHFEVHVRGAVVDPIPFLAARGVRI